MKKETKFGVGDIIATHIEHPHMVMEIVDYDGHHNILAYELLDLNTGKLGLFIARDIDSECLQHDKLTPKMPHSFDGQITLKNGSLSHYSYFKAELPVPVGPPVGGGAA